MADSKKTRITEPATDPVAEVDPNTKAVRDIIAALGFKESEIKGIDIRNGIIRVFGSDNSVRSLRVEKFRKAEGA